MFDWKTLPLLPTLANDENQLKVPTVSAIKGVDCIRGVWKVAAYIEIWYKHLLIGCKGKKVKVKAPCFMSVAFNSHHLTNQQRPTAQSLYSPFINQWVL